MWVVGVCMCMKALVEIVFRKKSFIVWNSAIYFRPHIKPHIFFVVVAAAAWKTHAHTNVVKRAVARNIYITLPTLHILILCPFLYLINSSVDKDSVMFGKRSHTVWLAIRPDERQRESESREEQLRSCFVYEYTFKWYYNVIYNLVYFRQWQRRLYSYNISDCMTTFDISLSLSSSLRRSSSALYCSTHGYVNANKFIVVVWEELVIRCVNEMQSVSLKRVSELVAAFTLLWCQIRLKWFAVW